MHILAKKNEHRVMIEFSRLFKCLFFCIHVLKTVLACSIILGLQPCLGFRSPTLIFAYGQSDLEKQREDVTKIAPNWVRSISV